MNNRPVASDFDDTFDLMSDEERAEIDLIATANDWVKYNEMHEKVDFELPIYFNLGKFELMDIVMHKANVINRTNARKFYEDQSEQVQLLKLLCPNCEIIKYG